MDQIFDENGNGLVVWDKEEIILRNFIKQYISLAVEEILLQQNPAWKFHEIETPCLLPSSLVNSNYTSDDVFICNEGTYTMRPETTAGSYAYALSLLKDNVNIVPMVVYQAGKSFRNEQDQVSKNMRLKEFYQLEFQCFYGASTLNDYHTNVLEPLCEKVRRLLHLDTRIVDSDRIPSYSLATTDLEVYNGHKWMEVCSISTRTDFIGKAKVSSKQGNKSIDIKVLEIAFGLDRLVYNFNKGRVD